VDDLILNTAGFLAGYGIFLLAKAMIRLCKRK
jgi:glycopeptide antibiotics resistance protein